MRHTLWVMASFGRAGFDIRTARRFSRVGSSGLTLVINACEVNAMVHSP